MPETQIQAEYAAPSDLRALFGLSRAEVYRRLAAQDFRARKIGTRTYVEVESVRDYMGRTPVATFRPPAPKRAAIATAA